MFWVLTFGGGHTSYPAAGSFVAPEACSHPGVSLPQKKVNQRLPKHHHSLTYSLAHTQSNHFMFLSSPHGSQIGRIWENLSERNHQPKGTLLLPGGGSCQGSPSSLQGATAENQPALGLE